MPASHETRGQCPRNSTRANDPDHPGGHGGVMCDRKLASFPRKSLEDRHSHSTEFACFPRPPPRSARGPAARAVAVGFKFVVLCQNTGRGGSSSRAVSASCRQWGPCTTGTFRWWTQRVMPTRPLSPAYLSIRSSLPLMKTSTGTRGGSSVTWSCSSHMVSALSLSPTRGKCMRPRSPLVWSFQTLIPSPRGQHAQASSVAWPPSCSSCSTLCSRQQLTLGRRMACSALSCAR
mmetsp:Transcript_11552/g.36925  ORF Transcript_11552/g.36925 Transcript_11552/m.36925 type:complete len:233 (+) Transcript_11552:1068-1766(+)